MSSLACALGGTREERVALCDVSVAAVLQDLLAEVTVAQTYRNDESAAIEAVYTFPLPLDAVLLEIEVAIGGRVLSGVVARKAQAEAEYEDAIAGGDAAVLLEEIEPGLYTLNVGSLLPRETARITFRYGILYRWTRDRLRIVLPATVAPRFGAWTCRPHQIPASSLTVENQFALNVEIRGSLRDAQWQCATHAVTAAKTGEAVMLTLRQARAAMDRDFVLEIQAARARRSFALHGEDGQGAAAVACFQPFFPGLQEARALKLAIVVDCSGSMQGDSIQQAKEALQSILGRLQSRDEITVIAFGSTSRALAAQPLPCTPDNLMQAKLFAGQLEADMGGTDVAAALRRAFAAVGRGAADILLLTDGAVTAWPDVVAEAKSSGHRIFTVGVGSAVAEPFVRQLAAGTGGACELVSPREDMAERVVRHFARMRAPRARRAEVRWPDGACTAAPRQLGPVFAGDTVVASARFEPAEIGGSAVLEVETDAGEILREEAPLMAAPAGPASAGRRSAVARLAAALRLKELDPEEGAEEALRYRLLSPWTDWLAVAARPDGAKADSLPALRIQPQTLAAGWHGVGMLQPCLRAETCPPRAAELAAGKRRLCLLRLVQADPARVSVAGALGLLRESGLDAGCEELFRDASAAGFAPEVFAAILLARILTGPLEPLLGDAARSSAAGLSVRAEEFTAVLTSPDVPDRDVVAALYQLTVGGFAPDASVGAAAELYAVGHDLLDRLEAAVASFA